MLITFEGIDGCGKSTQIELLADYIRSNGRQVKILREPGGTEFSESVRNLLLSSKNHIYSISELLLFEAARADLVENVIKPALSKGENILLDRFYDSTTAYQGYGRGIPLDLIKYSNHIATAGIKPQLTFYLDISLKMALERTNNKDLDRMELAGNEFFERVIKGYKKITEEEPERIVLIDGNLRIQEIHEIIIGKISHLIK